MCPLYLQSVSGLNLLGVLVLKKCTSVLVLLIVYKYWDHRSKNHCRVSNSLNEIDLIKQSVQVGHG